MTIDVFCKSQDKTYKSRIQSLFYRRKIYILRWKKNSARSLFKYSTVAVKKYLGVNVSLPYIWKMECKTSIDIFLFKSSIEFLILHCILIGLTLYLLPNLEYSYFISHNKISSL